MTREHVHNYPKPDLYDVVVTIEPVNPASAPISWIASDVDVVLSVGRGNWPRWELALDDLGFDELDNLVKAAIDGRVRETFGWHRSFVEVLHEDGQVERSTGGGLLGLVPLPGWKWWGRHVRYEPYA
ncbi:hypothetical protein [Aeromicrobium massiliense]|uniref:hypothetical protein n=1 Tax=Aeromicrobium massiliense TaxID=1464554 RepID=UPI00155B3860|nr:hypothetical protein [Aeromicrobium massiliense]